MADDADIDLFGLKLESRLSINDLEILKNIFMGQGDGYDDKLSLEKEAFCDTLQKALNKGTLEEYAELFDKIDVSKDGNVDWDKFASHLLLEYVEKDDRVKATQVPQWKEIRLLPSPHKDIIQKVAFLKNTARYIGVSKEGGISTWDSHLHIQKTIKVTNDSVKPRDVWVTTFAVLQNINKIALAFTSKEILIYDLSSKLEFNNQYRLHSLENTPLSMDYWSDPEKPNEAILVMGDTGGSVNAFLFSSTNIALFDRPQQTSGEDHEQIVYVNYKDLLKDRFKYCRLIRHSGHHEWTKQVKYASHLDCFISCCTASQSSMVLGWIEKAKQKMKTNSFNIMQGVNAFDYHENLNLIASAGVNNHVCLWNPYVVSKPVGLLRGHMAPVLHVQFNFSRGQLISFSKDKVIRIWDVQLQVCLQRIAGMFPKGPELSTSLFFHEEKNRLLISFNSQLTMLEMKPEVKDRILSHEKPVTCVICNSSFSQVVSSCQGSTVNVWLLGTGQKIKQFLNCHGNTEITTLAFDHSESRFFTGSTDGTVKMWDFNGHCHHVLNAGLGQSTEVSQVLVLKRGLLVVGWDRYITIFRDQQLVSFYVNPSEWKGDHEHQDDILCAAFTGPHTLATGSYDGEIIIWNTGSEVASRHLQQRFEKKSRERTRTNPHTEESTQFGKTHTIISPRHSPQNNSKDTTHTPADELKMDNSTLKKSSDTPEDACSSKINQCDDEQSESFITQLIFLEKRKSLPDSNGIQVVSCGSNGWIRFWNISKNHLLGEFVAHEQVSYIVMAVSKNNEYLVTGDSEGILKVWIIAEYCLEQDKELIIHSPALVSFWTPHSDSINCLAMCEKNDRQLILSASADCSMQLWDVYGNHIGTFGQEDHWKIEQFVPPFEQHGNQQNEDTKSEYEVKSEKSLLPRDEDFSTHPLDHEPRDSKQLLEKFNSWDQTRLGKGYQEDRMRKRERRQPGTIMDLPFCSIDRMGQQPVGPYGALDVLELNDVGMLKKPDFITHPHLYFRDRSDIKLDQKLQQEPSVKEDIKNAFDEKSLFPKYILDYEHKMRRSHSEVLDSLNAEKPRSRLDDQRKGSRLWGASSSAGQAPLTHVHSKRVSVVKPNRLSPLPEIRRRSSQSQGM